MNEVMRAMSAIEAGNPQAAEDLLPLVYAELKRLAGARLAREQPGQTLQPTALVHEAYLRLVGDQKYNGRGHFFAAAAEAMRRILIDRVRRKRRARHGGGLKRLDLDDVPDASRPDERLLALDEAVERLGRQAPDRAALVKLRYFAGLTLEEAAACLGLSLATAKRRWEVARAWLYAAIEEGEGEKPEMA